MTGGSSSASESSTGAVGSAGLAEQVLDRGGRRRNARGRGPAPTAPLRCPRPGPPSSRFRPGGSLPAAAIPLPAEPRRGRRSGRAGWSRSRSGPRNASIAITATAATLGVGMKLGPAAAHPPLCPPPAPPPSLRLPSPPHRGRGEAGRRSAGRPPRAAVRAGSRRSGSNAGPPTVARRSRSRRSPSRGRGYLRLGPRRNPSIASTGYRFVKILSPNSGRQARLSRDFEHLRRVAALKMRW